MAIWQFTVLAGLLVLILWRMPRRDRRDMILRRIFLQLNTIEAGSRGVPVSDVEKETATWWINEMACARGKPLLASRRCGPWCCLEKYTKVTDC
jgi:hypothetical protein